MQQFIEFFTRHWQLWAGFFTVLILLLIFEAHSRLRGLKHLSPHQITLLINRENAVVLDIREKESFKKGHIINAINIPLPDLAGKIKQLEASKNRTIIIVYGAGQTFAKAAEILAKAGFTNIQIAQGGIASWINLGLPLIKE